MLGRSTDTQRLCQDSYKQRGSWMTGGWGTGTRQGKTEVRKVIETTETNGFALEQNSRTHLQAYKDPEAQQSKHKTMDFKNVRFSGWILTGFCFGMSAWAGADPEFAECNQSFYKRIPPLGLNEGQLIHRCYKLGDGESFATLYSASCNITVFSAFCLNKEWVHRGETGESQDNEELNLEEDETHVVETQRNTDEEETSQKEGTLDIPALSHLLRQDKAEAYISSDPRAHSWDTMISEMIQNAVLPHCQSVGGDLYVLTGAGGVDGLVTGCEVSVFWSAMCCAVPEDNTEFSLGIVRTEEEGVVLLSVAALEQTVGVGNVFSGGCGKENVEGEDERDTALSKSALRQIIEKFNVDVELNADEKITDAEHRGTTSGNADEPQSETETNSTVMYVVSLSLSLLSIPFNPVVSTLTQIPSQASHVVQEDLKVLSALPHDTLSLFHNVVSDTALGFVYVGGLFGKAGGYCASQVYSCISILADNLVSTCMEGITGVGTLVCDGAGISAGVVDKAWSVSRFIVGRAWEQSEEHLWAIFSEMGFQIKETGRRLGKLITKGGHRVSSVVTVAGSVVGGGVEMAVETVMEAFENE